MQQIPARRHAVGPAELFAQGRILDEAADRRAERLWLGSRQNRERAVQESEASGEVRARVEAILNRVRRDGDRALVDGTARVAARAPVRRSVAGGGAGLGPSARVA